MSDSITIYRTKGDPDFKTMLEELSGKNLFKIFFTKTLTKCYNTKHTSNSTHLVCAKSTRVISLGNNFKKYDRFLRKPGRRRNRERWISMMFLWSTLCVEERLPMENAAK